MPNWCSNSIFFSGDKDNLQKLKKDLTQPVFAKGEDTGWLTKVINEPPPIGMYWTEEERVQKSIFLPYQRVCARTLAGEDLDHSAIGYDEMISTAVGCKWDFDLDVWEETDDYLSYGFSSPWSPPLIWVARIALKYKLEVKIEFEEGGADFAGKLKANGIDGTGILIESTCSQYRVADLGCVEEWIEQDIEDWCEDEGEIENWRKKAKDWPTTMDEYDAKYLTGEFDLKDHFIPGK